MIAFEFYVNGKHLGTAGVGDLGVLSATLTWVRRSPEKSEDGRSFEEELFFDIGGLSEHAHLSWLRRALSVGDSVSVKIIAAETVDAPSSSEPRDDAAAVERGERQYFDYLKQKYGRKKPSRKSKKS